LIIKLLALNLIKSYNLIFKKNSNSKTKMSEIINSMSKPELYEYIERKERKKLPSYNSPIVTKDWLKRVYYNEEYCPYYS